MSAFVDAIRWFMGATQETGKTISNSRELEEALRAQNTDSGALVNDDTAMQVATVYACVRYLSQSIAKLPLELFAINGAISDRAFDHPLYDVLNAAPNEYQTAYEFWQMLMGHLQLRGNAFALIVRSRNRVQELHPIHPDSVTVEQKPDKSVIYEVQRKDKSPLVLRGGRGGEVLHLKGLNLAKDGLVGLSPIASARQSIGLAMQTRKFGAKLFSNGARIGGVLEHPAKLSSEALKHLRDSLNETHGGVENAHKWFIAEEGMKATQLGMSAEDAEFITSRKFERSEIVAFFGIPPHKVGDLERATFTNIEHQSIEVVTDSLMPWFRNIEQAIEFYLLSAGERGRYRANFDEEALLRGDMKSQAEALQIQRRNGVINANEWREKLNRNPRTDPGGDEYIVERNMGPQQGNNDEAQSV